ncbi:MAG: electron transfer flavoprotein subunit beta/FixA family protein [Candidatus Dormibacteria bacterium]
MNVVVCIKQVPDPNAKGSLDPGSNTLVRSGVELVLDPGDEFGIEAGLQVAEATGGQVTIVSLGPPKTQDAIRKALSMGAHRAVLVTDEAFSGSDAPTTARALAAAIRREPFDLVICGTESTDGSTGMVPPMLAELLDVPQLTFAKHLVVEAGKATVHRQTAGGYQVVEATLPALVTVTGAINTPRYASLKGIMAAKSKEVVQLSSADLGLGAVGSAGALETVTATEPAPVRPPGQVIEDQGDGAARIADFLATVKVL